MSFVLQCNGEDVEILSRMALQQALEDLHRQYLGTPSIVHLIADSGATMNMGVGGAESFLNFVNPNGWPAFTALGTNPSARNVLAFTICGEESEIPGCFGMANETAKKGMLNFFETSEMPQWLDWQED